MPNLLDNLPTHDDVLAEIKLVQDELDNTLVTSATDLEIAMFGAQKAHSNANPRQHYLAENLEFFYSLLDEIEAEAVHAEALEAEFG
jgi:hypothetical protein